MQASLHYGRPQSSSPQIPNQRLSSTAAPTLDATARLYVYAPVLFHVHNLCTVSTSYPQTWRP